MRKRLGRMLICLPLVLLFTTGVFAANPEDMTDIEGHWAQEAISYCMTEGLYQGMSETEFAPELNMTRGMFVTVLGRIAGVDENEYRDWYLEQMYTDVNPDFYYAPYVEWATRYGIVNGMGDGTFGPELLVNREQMATMVVRFASIYNYELTETGETVADSFTDADKIGEFAREPVDILRKTGILNGYSADDGTYYYGPYNPATRAQCAALFFRLEKSMVPYEDRTPIDPEGISLSQTTAELAPGETMSLGASVAPAETTNQTVTWFSTDRSVVRVSSSGQLTAVGEGNAEVYALTWNGLSQSCAVTVARKPSLAYEGESYADKCIRIFGEELGDKNYRTYYDIDDKSYLVSVPVQVWSYTDSSHTEKYTRTMYLEVHKNIADTVQAIFEEIYHGEEQFPIYYAGGYRRTSYSEHGPGLAIDINPSENYECYNDGTPMTGEYWKPGEDPYSILPDGDVVRAFKKYGFGWGGEWRSKKDYMHFSFFGT